MLIILGNFFLQASLAGLGIALGTVLGIVLGILLGNVPLLLEQAKRMTVTKSVVELTRERK